VLRALASKTIVVQHRGRILKRRRKVAWFGRAGDTRNRMRADTAKAKAAYQDFLALWKDADPDIPILKQAKAEYAKLQ
jgi:eukaryotic-like serine/threonine-protein kinase